MRTGSTVHEQDVEPKPKDLLESLIESTSPAPPSQQVVPYTSQDAEIRYVPLNERWHQEHAPAPPAAPHKQPSKPRSSVRNIAPPKPVIVKVEDDPPIPSAVKQRLPVRRDKDMDTIEAHIEEDLEDDADDLRIHTLNSKFWTTILLLVFLYAAWRILWLTGAKYTIFALNGLAGFFEIFQIDIHAWTTEPWGGFRAIAHIFGWIPIIGNAFDPLLTLPKIWIIPIIITIGQSVLWPRRRRVKRDLVYFWKPLEGESLFKHSFFLVFMAFDILSTCVGAILDLWWEGGIARVLEQGHSFNWSIVFEAPPEYWFAGIALGLLCAVLAERVWSFAIRDIVGLWIPAENRFHRWFKPSGYVQYS